MKKIRTTAIIAAILFWFPNLKAQEAKITETDLSLVTYGFSDPDPIPDPSRIFPYFRFDGYSSKGTMKEWKMVVMENDYIKLWITPEIGGKIWGAVEKSTGKEFIYFNHVVKFRDVAMRGPWTSGGLEFNFGVIGHAPTCSSPVDYFVRKNNDGSASCFVGSIDLPSGTRWSVEINLPKDKAYFTTRSVWENPTNEEQSYYHWTNLGIKTSGNLEYAFPGNYYLGHDGKHFPYPVDSHGHQLNFYDRNNFGSYKSYHVFGELTDFYGGFWHNDNFGFGHYSLYDEKPGKKIWIWGLSDEGMIWEKLLTDNDGQYSELQSGRLFNQEATNSTLTPFKHKGFPAGSTDEWTEFWFPVKETNGLKYATRIGSVNLQQKDKTIIFSFCPIVQTSGTLFVKNSTTKVYKKEVSIQPLQTLETSFDYNGKIEDLSVWFDNTKLYDANHEKMQIKRPVEMPTDFNWESCFGHAVQGKEWEKQRAYKLAEDEYLKALNIDTHFVPALNGMANLMYKKMDYRASLDYALKGLSIDTYDPEANLSYARSSLEIGDTISAIDGFSIASANLLTRNIALNELASIYLNQKNYDLTFAYANKSLAYNTKSSEAKQLKITALRKKGLKNEALMEIEELEKTDPLNHFSRFEKYLIEPTDKNRISISQLITNEFPSETFLELAIWYYKNGLISDALKTLDTASATPMVMLWQSYLNHLLRDETIANTILNKTVASSPLFVFPYQPETVRPLSWAQKLTDDWKIKYYAGLIYLNANDTENGEKLWNECGNAPDYWPFYIARAIQHRNSHQNGLAYDDLQKAEAIEQNSWRLGLIISKFNLEDGNIAKALEVADKYFKKSPQNYYLGLQYAKTLDQDKQYAASANLLRKLEILPNEGATEGRELWRRANLGQAIELIRKSNYKKALGSISKAKEWPANLGVGRPYQVDERVENFLVAYCLEKSGKIKESKLLKMQICQYFGNDPDYQPSGSADLLTILLLKECGNSELANSMMKKLVDNNPKSKNSRWSQAIFEGNSSRANEIKAEKENEQIATPYESNNLDKNFTLLSMIEERLGLLSAMNR